MYFLGKLVKKATRAVKKVAKSPIGKAALLYAAGGLGNLGAGLKVYSKWCRSYRFKPFLNLESRFKVLANFNGLKINVFDFW